MKVIINNKKHTIPSIRELTVKQFINIMVKAQVHDLKQYLSLFTDIPYDEFEKATIKTASIPVLFANIFNANIKEIMKAKPNTVKHGGKTISINHVELNTYGSRYYIDKKKHSVDLSKTDEYYDFCLYALAFGLMDEVDPNKAIKIQNELYERNWIEVLPAAFFLGSRHLKTNIIGRLQYLNCIVGFRVNQSLINWSMKRLKKQEKSLLRKSFVKRLTSLFSN